MNDWTPQQKKLIRVLLLGLVLVIALFMAAIPRWNYLYPIHSDEWTHYSNARSLIESGKIAYPNRLEAGDIFSPDTEIGFHLFIAEVKSITGLSWLGMFRFLPGIILAMLAFQVYALARRRWTGLLSAFLVTLLPTTIRFLGPAFLVPVALGLTFIPVSLIILRQQMTRWRRPVMLVALLFSLLFIHPPSFIVISIIAIVHIVINLPAGRRIKSRPRMIVASLVGIIAIYIFGAIWASSQIAYNINEALIPQSERLLPPIMDVVAKFGYILPFVFAISIGILAYRGTHKDWALVVSAFGLLAFQSLYTCFFIGPDIIYERGWLYLYVLMAVITGIVLGDIPRRLRRSLKRRPAWGAAAGYGAVIALLVFNLVFSLRSHLGEPYYHLVDDIKYQEFLWVAEYVPSTYQTGITDIGIACPFAAVSGRNVYVGEVSPNFRLKEPPASDFLRNGSVDTAWLKKEGITMVYSGTPIDNDDLIKVNRNLYLLVEDRED